MKIKPWSQVPRDGTWVLPWDGNKAFDSSGWRSPVMWGDDGDGGMYWVDDFGNIDEELDQIAIGFIVLDESPEIEV
ncbi:MAG: hypothetical protein ACRCVX_11945 [Shewanella sp.]